MENARTNVTSATAAAFWSMGSGAITGNYKEGASESANSPNEINVHMWNKEDPSPRPGLSGTLLGHQ